MVGARLLLPALMVLVIGCSSAPTATEPRADEAPPPRTGPEEDLEPEQREEDRGDDTGDTVPCGSEVRDAVDTTITGQIEAFAADDYERALGLAATGYRAGHDVASFRSLIEGEFAVLAAAEDHEVGACRQPQDGVAEVLVSVTGNGGATVEMVYVLLEEPEGWRVAAAGLLDADDRPGIGV